MNRHPSPWRKLRELRVRVPKEFALLPPILLDSISTDWVLGPGNHLLTHYKATLLNGPILTSISGSKDCLLDDAVVRAANPLSGGLPCVSGLAALDSHFDYVSFP